MTRRRAVLVVPAGEPRRIRKAHSSVADEVVIDLEDAVAVEMKDSAREAVAQLPGGWSGLVAVRTNALGTPWFEDDLAMCAENPHLSSVVIPKVQSAENLRVVDDMLIRHERRSRRARPLAVQALIESPAGVLAVERIVFATRRLAAVVIGYADLAASLGRHPDAQWGFAQDAILFAARNAGIQAIDGPALRVGADRALEATARNSQRLGFDGKWVIHPQQLDMVRAAFTPSPLEVDEARGVLTAMAAAHAEGRGTVEWHGRMIDEAVAVGARNVIARADGVA